MRALQRITNTLPRATALRTVATRATTIDTLRARRKTSPQSANQPAISASNPLDLPSNQGVYGADWSSHFDTTNSKLTQDDRSTRSFYSTQIYHGQSCPLPSSQRSLHSDQVIASTTNPGPGPATGLGTGVSISAQMFGAEVKGNPTESEADVAADRSDLDPLPPELHHTIRLGAGEAAPRPTESEEDVVADRGGFEMDPLGKKGGR
jgi:hypothetical protein